MSFRYAPSFSVRGFGVKKLKMTTMRSHDASLRDFFARRYHVYLTTNFSKAASRVTDECFGLNSEWVFAKLVLLNGKLGVMRVVTATSQ